MGTAYWNAVEHPMAPLLWRQRAHQCFWHGYTRRWLWRTSAYSMAVFLPLSPMNMHTALIQRQELPTAS